MLVKMFCKNAYDFKVYNSEKKLNTAVLVFLENYSPTIRKRRAVFLRSSFVVVGQHAQKQLF